jgi:hypothetical protein
LLIGSINRLESGTSITKWISNWAQKNMKECEIQDPFTLLIVESFWKAYNLDEYFALQPPNYLVEWNLFTYLHIYIFIYLFIYLPSRSWKLPSMLM